MVNVTKFMNETRNMNRWFVLKVALAGAFFGALLAVTYMIVSLGMWFS